MNMQKRLRNKDQIAQAAQACGLTVERAPYGVESDEWLRVHGDICGKSVSVIISADTRLIQGTADGDSFIEEDVLIPDQWFSAISSIANGEVPSLHNEQELEPVA